jgi:hypothetical protein
MAGVCEAPQFCEDDTDCRDRACFRGHCVPRGAACLAGGCGAGELCVGGRCVRGEPAGACAACDEAADCASPAFCGDALGTGTRQCYAICGGDCPGDLRCVELSAATAACVDDNSVCPQAPACREDDLEDNDDVASATVLGGGADVHGRLCPGDPDVFVLRPRDGQRGTVTIDPSGPMRFELTGFSDGPVDIRVATRVRVDAGGGTLVLTADAAVTYRVTTEFGGGRGCANDGLEPNDTADDAAPVDLPLDLQGLVLCSGDHDFVRFRHDGRSTVVRIEFVHARGDIDAELLSAEGLQLATSTGNGDVERFDLGADLPAGDYVVHVYPFNLRDGQSTTYRLVIGR